MNPKYYTQLTDTALAGEQLSKSTARELLSSPDIDLFLLLHAAYTVRKKYHGRSVSIHIINNAQNGFCPEDCHYCAQAKSSEADIADYPVKSDEEILGEAKNAYDKGAHRYCMVFAGRGPSTSRVTRLANLIRQIKDAYPIEVCVSAGLLDYDKAATLKEAGLDRLNHNLNTSERHYPNICTTHTYTDRLNTLAAAQKAGLDLCSGVIIGMQETFDDIVDVAFTLNQHNVASIPVNFFMPIEGAALQHSPVMSPDFCLRALCLFRLLNPEAEIRIAAGRELYLRDMEVLAYYAANSLFLDGYLNAKGAERQKTYQMLKDAGFEIESEIPLDQLIEKETVSGQQDKGQRLSNDFLKTWQDLRPLK